MKAFKATDINMQCRGYQFELGVLYEHDGDIKPCESGFHACTNPIDVFGYYNPATSRFFEVELSKDSVGGEGDSKKASRSVTFKKELSLVEFVDTSVAMVIDNCISVNVSSGNQSAATNTGDWSAATNTGNKSAATNTGNQSASEVSGGSSVAVATGLNSKARASHGSAIVICLRDGCGKLLAIRSAIAGVDSGVDPDTWYTLDSDANFIAVVQ